MNTASTSIRRKTLATLPIAFAIGAFAVMGARAHAAELAAPTASPSGTTTGPATVNPRSSRADAMIGPDLSR